MESDNKVFDYRTLRLLMGIIALFMPIAVVIFSNKALSSISASYYTDSRDIFVGALFIVGAFLLAYNGHETNQAIASKVAAIAAFCVAYFPTSCDVCEATVETYIHYLSAITLFSILAYFCFVFFRKKIKDSLGKELLRSRIYFLCGSLMTACILMLILVFLLIKFGIISQELVDRLHIVYFGEWIAMTAFGIAWIVAGKSFKFFVEEKYQNHPIKDLLHRQC